MVKKIYNVNGIRSLYQGFSSSLIRDVPSFGVFFLTVGICLPLCTEKFGPGLSAELLTGGLGGLICWFVGFPADVIKTRMQSDAIHKKDRYSDRLIKINNISSFLFCRRYKSWLHCFREIVKNEPKAFTSGLGPCLLRAPPVFSMLFVGEEMINTWLKSFE